MKLLDITPWGSLFSSSYYALSLSLTPAFAVDLTATLELFNTTFPNVGSREVTCRSDYGTQLKWSSCKTAWDQIPRDSEIHVYGMRTRIAAGAPIDVGLPVRYLSDDGLCAIDIRARREHDVQPTVGDSAINVDVSDAAKTLLNRCLAARQVGGTIIGFSRRDFLLLAVTEYKPKAVCEPAPEEIPYVPFCQRVLQTMPARRQMDTFTFIKDRQGSKGYYVVPKTFEYPDAGPRCALTVSKSGQFPFSKATWFGIWAATVEVYTLCIQKGMSGSVYGLGDNKVLYMTMGAKGGPLALGGGCSTPGYCSVNATLLALDQKGVV